MPRGDHYAEIRENLPDDWKDAPILSYSQLQVADRCGFLWYTKYFLKLKPRGNSNKKMDTGSFTHQLLADLYTFICNGGTTDDWLNNRLNEVMMEIVDGLDFEDQIAAASDAMKLVLRYCQSDVLAGHTPVGMEQHFYATAITPSGRKFVLQIIIDLLTIDARKQVWIWDHKTGERMKSKLQVAMSLQFVSYLVLLRSLGMDIHGVCMNQINSTQYKDRSQHDDKKLFNRIFYTWTPGHLQSIWLEFMEMVEYTLDLMEGKIKARRSLRDESCYQCELVGPCHANLQGETLEVAVEIYSNQREALRGVPADGTVTILD